MKRTCGKDRIYLDSYVVQKDHRIRLPKGIEENLEVIPGLSYLS